MNDNYYEDLIVSFLRQWGSGTKTDFIRLLGDKVSDVLDEKQKDNKLRNLLMAMKRDGLIKRSDENRRTGPWVLARVDSK